MATHEERCEGVILQIKNVAESDQIITFFTEKYGRLVVRAPGARKSKKRFQGAIQSFAHLELAFRSSRSTLPTLLRLEMLDLHEHFREDLAAFAAASYLGELFLKITKEGDANPPLYKLLLSFIGYTKDHALTHQVLCRLYLRLLTEMGMQPDWMHCFECGKSLEDTMYCRFSMQYGSVLCSSCPSGLQEAPKLPESVRLTLATMQSRQSVKAPIEDMRNAMELLESRLAHLLGGIPQSRKFLKQMTGI